MTILVPFKAAQVFLRVALFIGLLQGFTLERGREGSLKIRFCVSGYRNSSDFILF